ncbi:MAG: hypothetical protein ACOC2E_07260 [Bacteroidota bacterium]
MNIPSDILDCAVKIANDLGKDGVRVLSCHWRPPISATQDPYGMLMFRTDNGPEDATETWEERKPLFRKKENE